VYQCNLCMEQQFQDVREHTMAIVVQTEPSLRMCKSEYELGFLEF
jgi:hypothetical protein